MAGKNIEHLFTIVLAAAGLDAMAQHQFVPVVVQLRDEAEGAATPRIVDRPACERASDFCDVFLGVPAVDPERVQFQQLASVVLVQTLWRLRPLVHLPGWARHRRKPPTALAPDRAGSAESSLTGNWMWSIWICAHPVIQVKEHCRTLRGRAKQIPEPTEDMRPD